MVTGLIDKVAARKHKLSSNSEKKNKTTITVTSMGMLVHGALKCCLQFRIVYVTTHVSARGIGVQHYIDI